MPDKLTTYKQALAEVPDTALAWCLHGAGMENFGRGDGPEWIPVPEPADDELLCRVDACGLCFSDIKIIRLGGEHPRLVGRDLARNPVIPGHEAALTIVRVGDDLRAEYAVGDRFIVQADIYYKGQGLAFGYVLPGALQQYVRIGREVLHGDEGCYLLPVKPTTGYAESALAEPWACVERSYVAAHRGGIKHGGTLLVLAGDGAGGPWRLSATGRPDLVLIHESVPRPLRGLFVRHARHAADVEGGIAEVAAEHSPRGLDDIVIFGAPSPELAESAAAHLAPEGILNLCTATRLSGPVAVDVGRVHYDGIHLLGTAGPDVASAYDRPRSSELLAGGTAWFIGAGGPMGQMHVQRAAEMVEGPALILATDVDTERLQRVKARFAPAAEARGARLVCLNPAEMAPEAFEQALSDLTNDAGFSDIVLLAPVPKLIEQAAPHLADTGVFNIFAGLAKGTMASLDLSDVALRGVRFTGTSGSAISDLQLTLGKTEAGTLSPNGSVAAIGGIYTVKQGLEGVRDGRFPGKVVIFPQLTDLPLLALPDLKDALPSVYAQLAPGEIWTREAEKELLRLKLPDEGETA